jgi:hypothetical protein
MKYTLLEMVQDILNDLDSDEVNSINDTVESQQVAQIIKTSFYEQIANRNWPHLRKLIQLESLGDVTKPNYLKIPKGMKELISLRYDVHDVDQLSYRMNELKYKEPEAFLRNGYGRTINSPDIIQVRDFSGSILHIRNDRAPNYWTSFDDKHIVTDSYDAGVDDTLQKSKTQCMAYIEPKWVHMDSAIPDLPDEAFPGLLEEAKSTAFLVLKQMANQKAEQKAARQSRWLSRKAWTVKGGIQYENYGRKGRR